MFLLLLVGVLGFHNAQAARAYFDGTFQSVSTVCPVTGNAVVATQSTAGYLTDPNEPFPKTGSIAYVRASSTNVSPCTNDAVGFEFFLPDGASLAIGAANPVRCYVVRLSDGATVEFTNNPSGFQGGCSQSPSTGANGGYYFGYAALPSGWQIQIHVPVQFNKQLLGIGGPNSHRLTVAAVTAYGTVFPYQPVTVFYQADFQNTGSSNVSSSAATLSTNLYSYFKDGQLYLDYGTTNSFGSSLSPANVPNTALNFPNISSNLSGLSPGTTYYWRYRFVTTAGTFNSLTQSFSTGAAASFALNVSKSGPGAGMVSSAPAGIGCGSTCSASFAQGTSVTLTATPASGSTFAGWSGACSGAGACTVTMDAAKSVGATFNTTTSGSFTLTVSKAGSGAGTVTSNPAGINCGTACGAGFSSGSTVTLSAAPSAGSSFAGWGGACTGAGACAVTMSAAQSVTATFNTTNTGSLGSLSLEVSGLPAGSSATLTITGPGGFSQTRTILTGTGQTLSDVSTGAYTVSAPSVVVGGTTYNPSPATQNVTVTTGSVTARVAYAQAPSATFALTVSKAGTGAGTVSSSPAGINCGSACSASFGSGASVILSAAPDSGSTFAGWSGACTGTGTCAVTMDAAKTVSATFGTAPAASPGVTAAKPASAPQNATVPKGSQGVPVLAFTLTPGATENVLLQSLTLQASGSGNDVLDLASVKVYLDANGNGQVDAGEVPGSGKFNADNGTFTLNTAQGASPGLTLDRPVQFLVAVDIASTLAQRAQILYASAPSLPAPLVLLLSPMLLLGALRLRSWRAGLLALLLALSLVACGGGTPAPVLKTYQVSLVALSAKGATSNQAATASGLSVQGATITVQK